MLGRAVVTIATSSAARNVAMPRATVIIAIELVLCSDAATS